MKIRFLVAIAVILFISCRDVSSPVHSPAPQFEISDAAHNGGTAHFNFLPPLVAATSPTGVFDSRLHPEVTICEGTSCARVIARFTTSTGPGSETIRVSDGHYIVNWHTDQFALNPLSTYRIIVSAGPRSLGHADVDVVGSGKELRSVDTDEFIGLVNGRTLPIKFRIEEGIPGTLTLAPASAEVGGQETQAITATVTDLHGAPLDGAAVSWSLSTSGSGVADPTQPLTPTAGTTAGGGNATTTFRAGTRSGTATVTAQVSGLSASASIDVNAARIALDQSVLSFDAVQGQSDPASQLVGVSNAGGGALSGLIVDNIVYGSGEPAGWVAGVLSGSSAPATMTVQVSIAGLVAGTYHATIPVTSPVAENSPQSVAVTLVVAPPPRIDLSSSVLTFNGLEGEPSPAAQTVTVSNGGGGVLSGLQSGTTAYASGQPTGWLSVSYDAAGSTFTFAATTGVLLEGTYSANVPIISAVASNSPQVVNVTFILGPAPRVALNVGGAGNGSGTVTSSPSGINCTITAGVASGTCSTTFKVRTNVVLSNTFSSTQSFTGWSGDCTGTGNCTLSMSQARNVTATFARRDLPDLVPTACRISPANPTTSDRIFFYVMMKNQGTVAAVFPSNAGMVTALSGGNYAGVTEGGLSVGVGASVEVYAYWPEHSRPAGTFPGVVATIEQAGLIAELDESNNSITCPTVTVVEGPKADLVITSVATTVSPVDPTTDYDFRITIKNQGNLASSLIQFPNRIAEGGSASNYLYPTSGFTLAPGASQTFTVPRSSFFSPAPGTHNIVFRVDPDLRVVESDEVNNAFTFALVVQQPPPPPPVDLVPTACRISPANPTTSDRIFFYVTMRNAGSANVTFPSNYGMITSLSGGNYAGVTEGGLSLAAGASVEVYAYWPENTRATGSYSGVVATLDQVNRIVETDETNNSITCPGFTVVDGPKADLVITNVETTVSPVNSTTDYDFRITIKNQGNLASSLIQFPNRIAEGGSASNYLYPTSGFTLAPGASQTFTVPRSSFFNPAPGTHSIVFRVDPDLRVFESDETNNTFTLQLVIQP